MDNNEMNELPMWAWRRHPVQAVWLTEYRTYGILLSENAYTGKVQYRLNGELVEEEIENDEYEYWQDYATEYEREE